MAVPMRFHANHSQTLKLSPNGRLLTRSPTTPFFTKGRAFTSRPLLRPTESIHLKLVKIASNIGGLLHIGFTDRNPAHSPRPIITPTSHVWKWDLPSKFLPPNTIITFGLDPSGKCHFRINGGGLENGVFDTKIPKLTAPLWALFDIYGNLQQIEVIDEGEATPPLQLLHQSPLYTFLPLPLHEKTKGNAIQLLETNKARRTNTQRANGCLFSASPLPTNRHYVIKLDQGRDSSLYVKVGVTSCNPACLMHTLPNNVPSLLNRPEYWVLLTNLNLICQPNDEIGVSLTDRGEIRLFYNGRIRGLSWVDVGVDLWMFVALEGGVVGVTIVAAEYKAPKVMMLNGGGSGGECVVCFEEKVDALLDDCGHRCMCYGCAVEQWRGMGGGACPLCRKKIKDVLQIE